MALLDLALEGMAVFGFVLFLVLWLMHFMAIIYTRLHLNKKATDKQPYSKLPGVSLLKPLKGVDPNLINNLETFFELDYPKVYFGTSHPRSYISANVTGFKCVTGMSCLMRKDVLDQAGGLIAFAQYIAEDYFMAKAIADRGWRFAMSTQVAMQNSGSYSISQFQSRMIRAAHCVFQNLITRSLGSSVNP